MKQVYENLKNSFYSIFDAVPYAPRDYAQKVMMQPKMVRDYLFKLNSGAFAKQYLAEWSVNKWCDAMEQLEATTEENNEGH